MSDEDDPFDRLGDVDREGDPFERLDDSEAKDEDSTSAEESPAADGDSPDASGHEEQPVPDDPFARIDRETEAVSDPAEPGGSTADDSSAGGSVGSTPATDPFADLDEPAGDPFGGADSVFERVDVGEVDTDEVWNSIAEDGDDGEPVVPDDSRYAEVSKHAFCQQCEHFAEPPDAHCTHESAEIIEYLDMEHVRLLDCPVVAEREDLE